MKALLILLICASTVLGQTVEAKTSNDQAKIREQLRGLIAQQKIVLENTERQLGEARTTATNLSGELQKAQAQADQVAKERDGWHAYGDDQHDKWMNAEKRVAEKEAAILRRNIVTGLLVAAIGIYAFLKFYLRLPI